MRIIFFTSYYEDYLNKFYSNHPGLSKKSYQEQIDELLNDHFGVFGSYQTYVNKLSAEAILIVSNSKPIQQAWAKENGIKWDEANWKYTIPIEQIKKYKPDVFFMSSMFEYYGKFINEVKKYVPKVFGWIACPIPNGVNLKQMDLILTSVPQFVENFRNLGVNSELSPQAFDIEILKKFPPDLERDIDFSFIGSLSRSHLKRIEMIKKLLLETPIKLFGTGVKLIPDKRNFIEKLISKSLAEQRHYGDVWGLDMYRILRKSKMTFNAHIDVSGNFAGNMRMYEATGMGTLLFTDGRSSASRIFSENEVVYYDTINDAIEKVHYFLKNPEKGDAIAKKGQNKTLADNNYERSSIKLLEYFKKYS